MIMIQVANTCDTAKSDNWSVCFNYEPERKTDYVNDITFSDATSAHLVYSCSGLAICKRGVAA